MAIIINVDRGNCVVYTYFMYIKVVLAMYFIGTIGNGPSSIALSRLFRTDGPDEESINYVKLFLHGFLVTSVSNTNKLDASGGSVRRGLGHSNSDIAYLFIAGNLTASMNSSTHNSFV